MAVDPKLLEILVCPEDKEELEVVELGEGTRARLVATYREHFQDEEPEVRVGLRCTRCDRVYPVVSGIPVMLVDEALQAAEVEA